MEQMQITDFFVAPPQPGQDAHDHFELGALAATFLIYLYRCAATGAAIYVGQTMQALGRRDAQHLSNTRGAPGSFDNIYTDPNMFTIEVLDHATFEADVGSRDEYRAFLRGGSEWADARETHFIDEHGTYDPRGPGLNRTRGGQGDALRALLEARHLQSCERWANVYAPAFERWMLDKGTDSLLHVAQCDVVQSPASADGTLPLGQLVSSIRSGNAAVPDAWRAWLDARGFAWNYQAAIWERVNIPAFERWMLDKGTDSLLHIPSGAGVRGIVQSPASADGTLQLGRLVNSIRSDTTAVPAAWRAWLDARGFLWHTQNLAAHVARRLQRAAPVDPGADADATVALSQLYGSGAFGRATCESLDGIVARYNADRARL